MTVEQITEPNRSSTSTAPAGYKQTELGIIPEDWCVSPIGQTHILATGTTPPTANTANYGDRYLFVSPADLGEAKYVLKTEKRLSERGFKLARQYPSGSTLFTCIGSTIGKTGLSREILTSNQQINAIFPSNDSDPEFVYYAVTHIAPRVKALAGQQAVPLVNKSEFGETLYCYPSSKTEQTAIANALSDVDALIQELEKLIAKKQAIKTATMQQLLTGRTRLPQFAYHPDGRKKGYKPSELGEIPEDWYISNVKQVSLVPMQNGLFYQPLRKGKGVPLINVSDMYKTAPIDVQGLELFDATPAEIKVFKVSYGDLFFTRSSVVPSGIAYCNIFHSERNDVVFDSHLIRVRPNTDLVDPNYLYLNCTSKHARNALIAEAKTATMTTIDQGAINRCPVLIPTKSEQSAIANMLSDMDLEIQALDQHLNKTRQIKQGMMQELLTGKTRLVKPAGAA